MFREYTFCELRIILLYHSSSRRAFKYGTGESGNMRSEYGEASGSQRRGEGSFDHAYQGRRCGSEGGIYQGESPACIERDQAFRGK